MPHKDVSSPCMGPALKLHRFVFLLEKLADQTLQQEAEMTFSQCMILRSLGINPDCSQRSIARCRDLTQAAVSRQVETLREKKLVLRKENAQNRREHILTLTAAGQKKLDQGMAIIQREFDAVFKAVSAAERTQLESAVDKLLESLKRMKDTPSCD
jgi:MarR family transcriptional regulator for hemolysin